ncbi:MAG: hypothetical protein ABI317_05625, partial [Gaiellales bacterium]
ASTTKKIAAPLPTATRKRAVKLGARVVRVHVPSRHVAPALKVRHRNVHVARALKVRPRPVHVAPTPAPPAVVPVVVSGGS